MSQHGTSRLASCDMTANVVKAMLTGVVCQGPGLLTPIYILIMRECAACSKRTART